MPFCRPCSCGRFATSKFVRFSDVQWIFFFWVMVVIWQNDRHVFLGEWPSPAVGRIILNERWILSSLIHRIRFPLSEDLWKRRVRIRSRFAITIWFFSSIEKWHILCRRRSRIVLSWIGVMRVGKWRLFTCFLQWHAIAAVARDHEGIRHRMAEFSRKEQEEKWGEWERIRTCRIDASDSKSEVSSFFHNPFLWRNGKRLNLLSSWSLKRQAPHSLCILGLLSCWTIEI